MRIEALSERAGADSTRYQVLCECGDESCLERVEVPVEVFADVRDGRDRFVVAPGHDGRKNERVVTRAGAYSVVAAATA